ncbi:MAG: formyltransferase family protein [Coriobacteriia bacterium]
MKKLTILAMTEKGYSVVAAIASAYPGMIGAVVGAHDTSVANDFFEEIAGLCRESGIPFFSRPESYSVQTEYVLAVSWRWIVNVEPSRLIVFHDSLLPRYRGFNPLVTSLINGDTTIGVSALYAGTEYDRGEIVSQSASAISYPITIQDAIGTILKNYRELATEIAGSLYREEAPVGTPQCESDASYSLWRDEEDYYVDWTQPATTVERTVDALGTPYRGAASIIEGKVVRVLAAKAVDDIAVANRTCGKVVFVHDSKPVVVCGKGLLRIDALVDDSGNSMLPLTHFRTRFKGAERLC